jgi:hypothetical protein
MPSLVDQICEIAKDSVIADYNWKDRGIAPAGYTQGMAVAFSTVVQKYLDGNSSAIEMAKANTGDEDVDVLSWYAGVFDDLDMNNGKPGLDTLRHLFALQLGLGMRESSGQYCCGRDMSAENIDPMTCEAGLFQMSWNMESCSPEMDKLMEAYMTKPPHCALNIFAQDVTCSQSDWDCYGTGAGLRYQQMAKLCPAFAVETTAVGLRNRRQHWGPINRYEAELRLEADVMLKQVQDLVTGEMPVAENSVTVTIVKSGNVSVTINGVAV